MKTNWAANTLITAAALTLAVSTAWAGPVNNNFGGHGGRQSGHTNTPILNGLRDAARHGGSKSDHPIVDALRHDARRHGYNSDHPIAQALGDQFRSGNGYYGGYYDGRHHHRDDYARAYRDVGIANAVVDLFGVAAGSYYPTPYYYPNYYAPAPVVYQPAPVVVVRPHGYYRTESVLVSPGHYEDVRTWVSEGRDARGVDIGHYEMHRQWVPDAYENRRVWVEE